MALVEFGSPEYRKLIEEALNFYAPDAPSLSFSMSETIEGAPDHLATPEGTFGWSFRVDRGSVSFAPAPSVSAAYRVWVSYSGAVRLTRTLYLPDVAGSQALKAELARGGDFRAEGDRPAESIPFMAKVHDWLVPRTFAT